MDFCGNSVWLNLIIFIAGIAVLVKGSDFFVDSAASLAKKLGVSDVIIGLTLVSIGTSLPELAANLCASFKGASAISLGNIVGSNFTNVSLILGLSCVLMKKIDVPKSIYLRDVFFMMGASVLLIAVLLIFNRMNWVSGAVFLLICIFYIGVLVRDKSVDESGDDGKILSIFWIIVLFPLGLMMIFAGAKMVVDNTIWASVKIGISQTVIASTVVALGTSLPELAVTISGILKKKNGIALGNIVGSNIFNIFFVLGVSSLISPIQVVENTMYFNLFFLLISDLLLLILVVTQKKLWRWNGWVFLALYTAFIIKNIISIK